VGDALSAQGGEILKFIGDGVMAYFPADDALFLPMVTANALAAARRLIDDIGAANEARAAGGLDPVRFGIGLHVGLVTFGNVGTEDRLDFTVIGPAVNRAARLESLTKELGVPVLASAEFREATTQPLVPMGKHTLRGVPEPVEVFTLPQPG
jgi:adenylate cyclase